MGRFIKKFVQLLFEGLVFHLNQIVLICELLPSLTYQVLVAEVVLADFVVGIFHLLEAILQTTDLFLEILFLQPELFLPHASVLMISLYRLLVQLFLVLQNDSQFFSLYPKSIHLFIGQYDCFDDTSTLALVLLRPGQGCVLVHESLLGLFLLILAFADSEGTAVLGGLVLLCPLIFQLGETLGLSEGCVGEEARLVLGSGGSAVFEVYKIGGVFDVFVQG